MDVIIVGSGVLGLLTARELVLSGARVTLLERYGIGKESSWAGGGILSPLCPWRAAEPITALCRWSQKAYPHLAADLLESTGIDPEWTSSGLLFSDCEEVEEAERWCESHTVNCVRLTESEFAGLEPGLRLAPKNPILFPDIAQIRNPRLLRALKADLERRGVRLFENNEVLGIKLQQGRVAGVSTRQGMFCADYYVIAAGAWSGLLGEIVAPPPIQVAPVKGQMLVFAASAGLLRHIVLSSGRYLIPRRDGRILVGSTVEHVGYDKTTTESVRMELSQFAQSALPALKACPMEKQWAGLRPGSPEGIPYIGPHPRAGNLFFNCGHFRNGFVMAPASARLLTDLIVNRPPIVSAGPYAIPHPN